MGYTYTTRRGTVYYLHTGPKRGVGIQHYFSTVPDGPVAETVPEGFEVYENPRAQVYLRRVRPTLIRPNELALVQAALDRRANHRERYLADVEKDRIVIHEVRLASTI